VDGVQILDPRTASAGDRTSATYDLGRALAGVTVGLRLDHAWRSYEAVIDDWQSRLRNDGATPIVLWTGERLGPGGEKTRTDLEEWSRLVECGVVGLGN